MIQNKSVDFHAVGADGLTRPFRADFFEDRSTGEVLIRASSVPPPVDGEAFELQLRPLQSGILRSAVIAHHDRPEYKRRGIPEVLIPLVARERKSTIQSSPTSGGHGTFRTPDADKMWRRLVGLGLAQYDPARDVYSCSPT